MRWRAVIKYIRQACRHVPHMSRTACGTTSPCSHAREVTYMRNALYMFCLEDQYLSLSKHACLLPLVAPVSSGFTSSGNPSYQASSCLLSSSQTRICEVSGFKTGRCEDDDVASLDRPVNMARLSVKKREWCMRLSSVRTEISARAYRFSGEAFSP